MNSFESKTTPLKALPIQRLKPGLLLLCQ